MKEKEEDLERNNVPDEIQHTGKRFGKKKMKTVVFNYCSSVQYQYM